MLFFQIIVGKKLAYAYRVTFYLWCVLVKNMERGSAITFMSKWIVHKSSDFLYYDFMTYENGFCISISTEFKFTI